jgi:hypothetical protein
MRQYAINQSYMSYQHFFLFSQKGFEGVFPMLYPYISLFFLIFPIGFFEELFHCFQDHKSKLIKGECYEEIRISDQYL